MEPDATTSAGGRRIQRLLFAVAFVAFAYFHQGGGWNQNARFALVRAIVEEGTFRIDSHLIYAGARSGQGARLVRVPVRDAEFILDGKMYALWWVGLDGRPIPLPRTLEGVIAGVDPRAGRLEIEVAKDRTVSVIVPDGASISRNGMPAGLYGVSAGNFARVVSTVEPGGRIVARSVEAADQGTIRGVTYVEPDQVACTGDVAFHEGHFHPNKAPGGAFVAVPAYFLIHGLERMAGIDPDDWWTLTLNAWLISALSVGLLSALACVLFFRLALSLSGGRALESLLATFAFAFGTMFFPYGTSLYEHNVIAAALLASFYLLFRVRETATSSCPPLSNGRARLFLGLAGFCAGYAAITNYIMAGVVVLFCAYLLLAVRRKGGLSWFGLGLLGPFLLICAYNVACFSTPFTTNYSHENPVFKAGGAFLGVFLWPQWRVFPTVLFSPYRGLFIGAPVLLMAVYGLIRWTRNGNARAEARLMISILAFFMLFIMTFNGWHGGWAVGPRYLAPALPFLALPLVAGFVRFFRTTCALAVLSVAIALLVTAVDPQAPVGNARLATVDGRPDWLHSPLTEYEWPLFAEGHPWPLLRAQRDRVLSFYDETMRASGEPAPVRARRVALLRNEIDGAIRSGEPAPLLVATDADGRSGVALSELSTIVGPVSVNPIGVYEGWMYRVFPPGSNQADWNSFNAGEFLFERSRWSLAPLLAVAGLLVCLALRLAARLDRRLPR